MNGKRMGMQRMNSGPQEPAFQQHEQLVQYLYDCKQNILQDFQFLYQTDQMKVF